MCNLVYPCFMFCPFSDLLILHRHHGAGLHRIQNEPSSPSLQRPGGERCRHQATIARRNMYPNLGQVNDPSDPKSKIYESNYRCSEVGRVYGVPAARTKKPCCAGNLNTGQFTTGWRLHFFLLMMGVIQIRRKYMYKIEYDMIDWHIELW